MNTFDEIMAYSPGNKQVFENLASLCIRGLISPYIGAGFSHFACFKTWGNLITSIASDISIDIEGLNYFDAAEKIENHYENKEDFYEKIKSNLGGYQNDDRWNRLLELAQEEAISVVPKLFFSPILTTNFDQIIEKIYHEKLVAVFHPYIETLEEELKKAIHKRKQIIYKIHGCVSDPNNIIFTRTSYENIYKKDSTFVKYLSSFFNSFHFLFLGCSLVVKSTESSLVDYPIELWKTIQDSGAYHFAILNCNETEEKPQSKEEKIKNRRNELENNYIRPILYPENKHGSNKIILDELWEIAKNSSFEIPKYTKDFFRRTENIIENISSQFEGSKCGLIALIGNAGMGKTRIMREYALLKKMNYRFIFWFNSLSAEKVQEEIRLFVIKYKNIPEDEKNSDKIKKAFSDWLLDNDNDSYIFLLDNVEAIEDIGIFLTYDLCKQGLKRHILLTTRLDKELISKGNEKIILPYCLTIDTFSNEDAPRFLTHQTKLDIDDYAKKIAEYLGNLPLALEQASAFINEEEISYQEYYSKLKKDILTSFKYPEPGAESVRATWNISMQRIQCESAKELLYLCAYFAPDNIHTEWFLKASEVLPFNLKTDIKDELNNIEKQLKKYSLVRIEDNKISIHRLLQLVIKKTLLQEKNRWVHICSQILDKLMKDEFSDPQLAFSSKNSNDFSNLKPHLYSIITEMEGCDYKKEGANLFLYKGVGYFNDGEYSEAQKCFNHSLDIYKDVFGDKKCIEKAVAMNALGGTYLYQNKPTEAQCEFRKALDVFKCIGDNNSIGDLYNNIGITYRSIGDDSDEIKDKINYNIDALKYLEKAKEFNENRWGKSHYKVGTQYVNIAGIYSRLGNYEKALDLYKEGIAIRQRELGKIHFDTACIYDNMGYLFFKQGEFQKATDNFQEAISIIEEVRGKNHPRLIKIYNNMADAYQSGSNYQKALDCHFMIFIINDKNWGGVDESTIKAKRNMELFYNQHINNNLFSEWLSEKLKNQGCDCSCNNMLSHPRR